MSGFNFDDSGATTERPESSAQIVPGENWIRGAGDDVRTKLTATWLNSVKANLTNLVVGLGGDPLDGDNQLLNAIKSAVLPHSKFDANGPPTTSDDGANTSGRGVFKVRSKWYDQVSKEVWECLDNGTGEAVWVNTSFSVDDLGTAAAFNVGSNPYNIVQLDGAGKLPAFDGSQLLNLPSAGGMTTNLSEGLSIETGWPGLDLKPTEPTGFGYVDFGHPLRPTDDYAWRLNSYLDDGLDVNYIGPAGSDGHKFRITADGHIWASAYGWLHDKFAAKDDGFTTIQEIGMGSPASSITFNNLSDYRELRLRFLLRPVNDNVHVFVRTSTDNGVNFDSGLSDYSWCRNYGYNGGSGADGYVNDGLFKITPGVRNYGGAFISGILHISQFNQNDICPISCEWTMREGSGNVLSATSGGFRKASVARDAMRMQFSAGDIASGYVRLEGLKS